MKPAKKKTAAAKQKAPLKTSPPVLYEARAKKQMPTLRSNPLAEPKSGGSIKKQTVVRKKVNNESSKLREETVPYLAKDTEFNSKLRFIDLFAGIGGIRLGLERAGAKCVFSSEWDSDANKTYEAYFGDKPAGDITKIKNTDIPDHDILAGGFPCQAFSIIGGMKGFGDTRGTLFFEIERILRAKSPRAFLLENVRNLVSHDKCQTFKVILEHLKLLGYHVHWRVLNALHYNLPQKRERVIVVGFKENHPFEWPKHQPLEKTLSAILEPDEEVNRKKLRLNNSFGTQFQNN
jgi:site-specific DNA-cytosine methylase